MSSVSEVLANTGIAAREIGYVAIGIDLFGIPPFPAEWLVKPQDPYHVTLKWGIITSFVPRVLVRHVLRQQAFPTIRSMHIADMGRSRRYSNVVLTFDGVDGWYKEAHSALSMLPHVDSFAEYEPHITLGAVKIEHLLEAHSLITDCLNDDSVQKWCVPTNLIYRAGHKDIA